MRKPCILTNIRIRMTERVQKLLKESEWKEVVKDRKQLQDIFSDKEQPIFDKVIDFHIKYGGLTIFTGKEPITFGVHHLNPRGEFIYEPNKIIEFDHYDEYPELSFLCADTLCQIRWTIDKNGHIFEDFDLLTESFEAFLEDYALWNELVDNGWNVIKRNIYGKELKSILDKFENIKPIDEIQEPGIKWFRINAECFLIERNSELILFGERNLSELNREDIVKKIE